MGKFTQSFSVDVFVYGLYVLSFRQFLVFLFYCVLSGLYLCCLFGVLNLMMKVKGATAANPGSPDELTVY